MKLVFCCCKVSINNRHAVQIPAHYVTEKGEHKQTILLASGWYMFTISSALLLELTRLSQVENLPSRVVLQNLAVLQLACFTLKIVLNWQSVLEYLRALHERT